MKEHNNILDVAKILPDYMGFIFYDKSPRYVGEDFEIPAVPRTIKKVGVFVNEDVSAIKQRIDQHELDFVQLHGGESIDVCKELATRAGIIKAFSIDDAFDFETVKQFQDVVDFFLFDAKGKNLGGNGISFNWQKLNEYNQVIPFLLSGGLTVKNVDRLRSLEGLNIHGIDINSGAEILPGLKSIDKVKEIKKITNELHS